MRANTEDAVGLAQFAVEVDGIALGRFTTCDGLQAEYTFEDVMEGGNNGFVYRLPGRIKYQNVKLSRPLSAETTKSATWFSSFANGRKKRGTAKVTVIGADLKPLGSWVLSSVFPARWTGPSFSAETNGVAKETLELAYHGFAWQAGS